jgi:hypothetical protein
MLIKRKWFALSTGYHFNYDCHHGFTLALWPRWRMDTIPDWQHQCRYRLVCGFCFNFPRLIWYNKHWALNEPGYIQGQPILRAKPKKWRLRGIQWDRNYWWHWHD